MDVTKDQIVEALLNPRAGDDIFTPEEAEFLADWYLGWIDPKD